MNEYVINYIGVEDDEEMNMVASGFGKNEAEAVKDFMFWHNECKKIESVKLYK